jgi:DNA-binding MltR family transcriptional regulator
MSNDEGGGAISPIKVEAVVTDDKRQLMLRLGGGESGPIMAAFDTASVEALITALGTARSEMLQPVPDDFATLPITAYNPRWRIGPDSENKFTTFAIRHPGFGWSAFGFPRHEAGNMAKWLRKIIAITSTRDTQSPQASSFGGDTFLITTEGLGFYYYGKGEKRIGPNPFEQIEFDSDRAAGIVAGSIAETRLEQALRSRLRTADTTKLKEIVQQLFRPSGALGSFSTKIDLGYLMRLLSDEAYKDLTCIKNIRNDFAHELGHDSFDVPSIRDRCKNLILVDRHVGPIPNRVGEIDAPLISSPNPYMGLPDYKEKLSDPRFRYTMTSQLISYALGEGSDNPNCPLPLV